MKLLLVTTVDKLAEKFAALSPELEYCAAVVDDVEPAKEVLAQVGLSQVPLYPMRTLQKCVDTLKYDYVLLVQDKFYGIGITQKLQSYGLPTDKLVSFAQLPDTRNWQTERHLRYYREHAQDFEMFATGTSYTETSIDIRKFKRKAFNFGTSSQDLYYSFSIAKSVVLCGGGHNSIRYALIGLAPYVFHFDLSKTYLYKSRVMPYLIAFNDIHNLPIPFDVYKQFLREDWLNQKPSIEKVNLNGVKSRKVISDPLTANHAFSRWDKKNYPKTRDENIKILDDYLTLCEENDICPIMFLAPMTEIFMTNFNKQMLEEFHQLVEQAKQNHPSARFVDGWQLDGFTYDDFYDHQHLNLQGAAKFSAYLNDFIEQLER